MSNCSLYILYKISLNISTLIKGIRPPTKSMPFKLRTISNETLSFAYLLCEYALHTTKKIEYILHTPFSIFYPFITYYKLLPLFIYHIALGIATVIILQFFSCEICRNVSYTAYFVCFCKKIP